MQRFPRFRDSTLRREVRGSFFPALPHRPVCSFSAITETRVLRHDFPPHLSSASSLVFALSLSLGFISFAWSLFLSFNRLHDARFTAVTFIYVYVRTCVYMYYITSTFVSFLAILFLRSSHVSLYILQLQSCVIPISSIHVRMSI